MTDDSTPDTEELDLELSGELLSGLTSLTGATGFVRDAIDHGIAAATPITVGDVGVSRLVPDGYRQELIDVRAWEERPRNRQGVFKFVDVNSAAVYANTYMWSCSTLYGMDPYGRGLAMLRRDTTIAEIVLDDHPNDGTGLRQHRVQLVLRPTPAAQRWGGRIGETLSQEDFLDLIVDGIAEIAYPDGAYLRDLVADLHAIRSTSVQSVVRTGGETAVTLAENVKLHTGPGNQVTMPEAMTIMFNPFVDADDVDPIELNLRIKPSVRNDRVTFQLTCADLDAVLAVRAYEVADRLGVEVERDVLWTAT